MSANVHVTKIPRCVRSAGALFFLTLLCGAVHADVKDGIAAYQRGDYAAAVVEFRSAAAQDDMFALNVLGTMYAQGLGVERNYKLALDNFFKAQALGSPDASANLARMYATGIGIPQDNASALRYYRDAAHDGFRPAIMRLAEIYAAGELGVTADATIAQGWRDRLGDTSPPRADVAPAPVAAVPLRSGTTTKASPSLPQAPRRDAVAPAPTPTPAPTHSDSVALFEKQVFAELEKYRQRERKRFVAASDNPAPLAAYLDDLRRQLKQVSGAAFSTSNHDEYVIVSLSILRDGRLREIELNQKSGSAKIDRMVLASLGSIARLEPPPPDGDAADVLVVSIKLPVE